MLNASETPRNKALQLTNELAYARPPAAERAVLFFWSAAVLAGGALICLVLGVVHFRRRHRS